MAGNWIKWTKGLTLRREVVVLASKLKRDRHEIAARLMNLWEWCDDNSTDDDSDESLNVSLDLGDKPFDFLDTLLGLPGMAEAMASTEVRWLEARSGGRIVFPKLARHNGTSAKTRAYEALKKSRQRKSTVVVPKVSPKRGDKSGTRGEESRGEVKTETPSESCPEPPKPAASGPSDPPILIFPAVGNGAKEWHLTKQKLGEWVEAFPGVDVLAECRKARQWCIDNPERRKTAKGMPSFLLKWLGRSQNSGPRSPTNQSAPARFQTPERREIDQMARYAEDALGIKK